MLGFSQVAGIAQARRDLFTGEIGKLSDNVLWSFAGGQIPQHEANRNAYPLQARLVAQDFRPAHDVAFPFHWHEAILARLHGKGKN